MISPTTGTSGRAALDCCRRAKLSLEQAIRSPLGDAGRILLERDRPTGLALVPPGVVIPGLVPTPTVLPRIISIGTRLAPGLVLFLSINSLIDVAARTAALEAFDGMLRLVNVAVEGVKGQPDDCERCVKKYLWRQTKLARPKKELGRTRDALAQAPARPRGRPPLHAPA
jgi:hypothetical protein